MHFLNDVITYVRRLIKSPSNASISDNLIIDYINRFYISDVDAEIQLFDLKTTYRFQTQPGVDQYNMPLYNVQSETPNNTGSGDIGMYPVYQGFLGPAFINGIQVPFDTQKNNFFNIWPNVVQQGAVIGTGNGKSGPYTLTFSLSPSNTSPLNPPIQALLRGHVDITGVIATGNNVDPPTGTTLPIASGQFLIPYTSINPAIYFTATAADGSNIVVQDSGVFLTGKQNYGLLIAPGPAPYGYSTLAGGYSISFAITGITQANPAVLTTTTTYDVGQTVQISGVVGMTELNGNTYTITAKTPTTITINVNSTSFTAYSSGGVVSSLQNVINYFTGIASNVFFPAPIPVGANINGQCYFFQAGLPRGILYYNNTLTLRSVPDRQYLVELDAYLSPCAFFNTSAAIPFGYMAEYISLGAARKILSDTGDVEQYQFYEKRYLEQKALVWKRSQRQWTASRTQTIYSQGLNQGQSGFNSLGGSTI